MLGGGAGVGHVPGIHQLVVSVGQFPFCGALVARDDDDVVAGGEMQVSDVTHGFGIDVFIAVEQVALIVSRTVGIEPVVLHHARPRLAALASALGIIGHPVANQLRGQGIFLLLFQLLLLSLSLSLSLLHAVTAKLMPQTVAAISANLMNFCIYIPYICFVVAGEGVEPCPQILGVTYTAPECCVAQTDLQIRPSGRVVVNIPLRLFNLDSPLAHNRLDFLQRICIGVKTVVAHNHFHNNQGIVGV